VTFRLGCAAIVLAAAAGCVSALDCVNDIPEDLRADVLRYVVDRKLCKTDLMPEADYAFAVGGGGRRYETLDDDRRRLVSLYATGYTNCLTNRVSK
jgi:hypothetical protein